MRGMGSLPQILTFLAKNSEISMAAVLAIEILYKPTQAKKEFIVSRS